jgi:general secretion pathway protein D
MTMNKPPHIVRPPRRLASMASVLAAGLLCAALAPETLVQAQSTSSRFRGEPVTLNFVNADIEGVTRAMAAILKQQFIVDPRVKGTMTLYSEEPMSPREAYLNFLAALRGLGFTVVEAGGLFKVVPEADAKVQTGTVSVGDVTRRGDQVMTQIFRLNHENANNLVPVLRPLIGANNTINANPGNNTLIITDYADNLLRIGKIIAAMDTPGAGEVEVILLKHAVASDVAALVQRLSDTAATPGVPGGAATGAPTVLVDPRNNSLIVRAPNASRMATIRSLVGKLDQPTGSVNATGNIWVVYLKNADATKLASVLRAAYSANSSSSSGAGASSNSPAPAAPPPGIGGAGTAPTGASPQTTASLTASAGPSTGGFIQADPSTNSLIITAPEPLYRQLRTVIDQLDSRRAQVYIESMIVKVDANKVADFGFQWQGVSGQKGDGTILGAGTSFGSGNSNIINLSAATAQGRTGIAGAISAGIPAGFNVGILKKIGDVYTLGALARFLETNLGGNVLSTPNLIALDNEEARIVIGQNVPFITGSFTNTGAAGGSVNPFQTVERKDVGLTLKVKPQIGEGGTVRMVIYQENSSVSSTSATAGPTTDKSAIETTVVVDDGAIMVLGGLLKDEYSGSVSKVPYLGDIPVLGNLFRLDNRSRSKSNLMVFLRPVVIRSQQAADAVTLDRYDSIRAQQKESQPTPSLTVPINEGPVLPPLRPLPADPAPALAPAPAPTSAQPAPPASAPQD